ncbi:MAG: ribbon-helix-helix protein, CopG family, partial [Verrucomicrobiae bacterium]|nr:ribbon-helix-helix protein, CopG family [Verrucomicrobiae bacterium]
FGETLPVRLTAETNVRLKRIAKATGLNRSDVMRIALAHGLPRIEAGEITIRQDEAMPEVAR